MAGTDALGRESVRESVPRIVIVGRGFGGLAAAKPLENTPAKVILIDRIKRAFGQEADIVCGVSHRN